ncbi:hypothetical protein MTP99_002735 [Tenebrio molitor]|nr:hypothetical protein MTP99_002735 [Tenebrio molitor]
MSSSPEAEQPVILEPEELVLDEPQPGTSVSHSTQPGTSASHSTQPGTSTSHTTEPIDWSTYTPAKLMSSKLNSKLCGSSKNMSRRRPAANSATESVALKFEKVGTLKEEIAQYQLAYVKAQLNEIEVAKKREAEIFELKKKALMLDIEIKEEQLNALRHFN